MMGPVVSLTSSNLASCQYDPETQELRITFHQSGTYTYQGVDQSTFDGLVSATSAGKYFHANIRNRFSGTSSS